MASIKLQQRQTQRMHMHMQMQHVQNMGTVNANTADSTHHEQNTATTADTSQSKHTSTCVIDHATSIHCHSLALLLYDTTGRMLKQGC